MAVKPDYNVGTVSLAEGGTVITGVDTFWESSTIQAGDTLMVQNLSAIISEVTDNNHIELVEAWTGDALVDAPYRIRFQSGDSRYTAAVRDLIVELGNGNIQAFAALVGALDLIPIFTGTGALTTINKSELVTGVAFDEEVDTLAGRAAYDTQAAGFTVLVADNGDGRAALYTRVTATAGVWSAPSFITGPIGPTPDLAIGTVATLAPGAQATATITGTEADPVLNLGIPAGRGPTIKGPYNPATTYKLDDQVTFQGSSWIAKGDTTGNAPPTLPTDSNAFWQLVAAKGVDGSGTGDLVGPASATSDSLAAFNGTTGKLLKDSGIVVSAFVKTILDDANAAAVKTTLALVKADVGLGNVDNTSDANKPVSTAQAAAIAGKQNALGYTPINPNGSVAMIAGLDLANPGTNVYQLDASGTVAVSQGAGILYSVGSGLLIVNDNNNGGVGVFACGGGQVAMIANVGGSFTVNAPNNPNTTNVFFETTFSRYQVQNMRGGVVGYGILFLKTRTSV